MIHVFAQIVTLLPTKHFLNIPGGDCLSEVSMTNSTYAKNTEDDFLHLPILWCYGQKFF